MKLVIYVKQILEILILKFLANFWNFTFGLSLCSSSSGAAQKGRGWDG